MVLRYSLRGVDRANANGQGNMEAIALKLTAADNIAVVSDLRTWT